MTLEEIRLRCFVDAETGCWIWRGAKHGTNGQPIIYIRPRCRWGRRVVFNLSKGQPIDQPLRKGRYTTLTCQQTGCLNPEHIRLTTKSAYMRKVQISPTRRIRQIVAQRKRADRKLDMAKARQIRAWASENVPSTEIARRMGVSRMTVRNVVNHKYWRETTFGVLA